MLLILLMYTTLDHLSQQSPRPSHKRQGWTRLITREIPIFTMFVFFASIVTTIFVNAPVFVSALSDLVRPTQIQTMAVQPAQIADVMQQEFAKQYLDTKIQ